MALGSRISHAVAATCLVLVMAVGSAFVSNAGLAQSASLPEGFVRLAEIEPSIRQHMVYAGNGNFLGRPATGYLTPTCILTRAAAQALARAQTATLARGETLVVFDCYRPRRAVKTFMAWASEAENANERNAAYHPTVPRGELVARGYIARKSSHARGSTVDIAIAPLKERTDMGERGPCRRQSDRTLDFGTPFDCFHPMSRTDAVGLSDAARHNRKRLLDVMTSAGFRNYEGEWWHFTLLHEPFPSQDFDFPVR